MTRSAEDGTHDSSFPPSASIMVIANAAAGSADDTEVDRVRSLLADLAHTDVVVPRDDEQMREALGRADGRDVVVLGGDGSLNWVVSTCVMHDLMGQIGAFGVVPMGTGNDFARGMGLPLDPAEAVEVAVGGSTRACDVLVDDDGNVVVNAVHAGIAAVATGRAETFKDVLGAAAYGVGALSAGVSARGWDLVVRVDGTEVLDDTQDALMVTIAVGGSVGGGTRVAPEARHHDGKADVMVATALGAWDRVSFAADLRRGDHVDRDDVAVFHGREITVESADPQKDFLINADGDLGRRYRRRTWTLRPQAWVCRVPGG